MKMGRKKWPAGLGGAEERMNTLNVQCMKFPNLNPCFSKMRQTNGKCTRDTNTACGHCHG